MSGIDEARALLGADRSTLLSHLGATAADLHEASYGRRDDLERVRIETRSAAHFYLANGQVVLAYFPRGTVSATPAMLAAAHPDAVVLPSRAGPTFAHHVDSQAGIAWSDDGRQVAIVEVFPPTDLDLFRRLYYQRPAPYVR